MTLYYHHTRRRRINTRSILVSQFIYLVVLCVLQFQNEVALWLIFPSMGLNANSPTEQKQNCSLRKRSDLLSFISLKLYIQSHTTRDNHANVCGCPCTQISREKDTRKALTFFYENKEICNKEITII